MFTQAFIQTEMKENIESPRHWPLWGEFTGDRPVKASNAENDDVIIDEMQLTKPQIHAPVLLHK